MSVKQPLLVHFLFHPSSSDARELARQIHRQLNRETVVPRLRVPTIFCPVTDAGRPPKELDLALARRNAVVVLADDYMVIDPQWCRFVADTWERCQVADARCLPIQLSSSAWPLDERLKGVNFSRAFQPMPARERLAQVTRRIVVELCRFLRSLKLGDDESKAPVKVFLSHTKLDFDSEPKVTQQIIAALKADQPIRAWVDSGDIPAGSEFAKQIASGIDDSSLLVVLTDNFSTREACMEEVMLAKEHDRPIAIVDGLLSYEVRSFPFAGNVPRVRWCNDPQAGIDLLLKETLRTLLNLETLSRVQRPGDTLFSRPPELATIIGLGPGASVLYPDPPLGMGETKRLAQVKINVTTPLQRISRGRPLKGRRVAMSMSESTDIQRHGFDPVHLSETIAELSRYLLIEGATLAYGGHLGSEGLMQTLFELVRTYNSDLDAEMRADLIVNFRGWPAPRLSVQQQAELAAVCRTEQLPRPMDIDETLHADFKAEPEFFEATLSALHRFAWARGMTEMRAYQSDTSRSQVAARVVLGGAFGPTEQPRESGPPKVVWYSGRIPGVLEEVMLSARSGQPVFLLGAFGGAAGLVIDLLRGIDRPEATWAYQQRAPFSTELRELYARRGLAWDDYPDMVSFLRAKGIAGINPLLSVAEHEQLFDSVDPWEMAELLLLGLSRLTALKR